MDFKAETRVTIELALDEVALIQQGIREMYNGWVKGLSKEEAETPESDHIRYVRILPNNLARAVEAARGAVRPEMTKLI